jgi:hypothetical protein
LHLAAPIYLKFCASKALEANKTMKANVKVLLSNIAKDLNCSF